MNSWIMVMWIISSLMACWSFSLFIRLISEVVAQKQNQMVAKKSTRSLWIGFVLIFVCGATSVFAARAAIHIENTFGGGLTRWTTPIALVCGTAGLFGICMFIWAWVGDRPRGRTRCPKCWYDMSAATGLLCPECGRTAKSPKKFSKTRRPKWAFVVAMFFFIVGGYGFSVSKRVAETDWLAAVPSWFLMLGWEHLPEEWILDDNSPYLSTLEERLGDNWSDTPWISNSRSGGFGRKLCRGFLDNKEARWDPRRLQLIHSIGQNYILYKDANDADKQKWIGPPIDPQELLSISMDDAIDAFLTNDPSIFDIAVIEDVGGSYYSQSLPSSYGIAKNWFHSILNEEATNTYQYGTEAYMQYIDSEWDLFYDLVAAQFSQEQKNRIVVDKFREAIVSSDLFRQEAAMCLINDTQMFEHFMQDFLDPNPSMDKINPQEKAIKLGWRSLSFSPEGLQSLYDGLDKLLSSGIDQDLAHVLNTLIAFQRAHKLDEQSDNEQYILLFSKVIARTIDHHKMMYPSFDNTQFFDGVALRLLIKHDTDCDQSYPLVLQQLLKDASEAPYLQNSYDSLDPNDHIKPWIEHFAPLIEMNDPDINTWLINNLPVQLGTEFDDQLDQIAVHFLDDPDEEIREFARHKLEERLADILITH